MLTQCLPAQTVVPGIGVQAAPRTLGADCRTATLYREQKWRHLERDGGAAPEDIAVSRWSDARAASRHEETTTPADRYVIGVALKSTRLTLARGRQILFDGNMPAGTLHVSGPSKKLSAHFHAPFDFLHFHIAAEYFEKHRAAPVAAFNGHEESDLILLRDSLAAPLARAVLERVYAGDHVFARCAGQMLAVHVARLENPRDKVNALPKWRLRRVEEHVGANFNRRIGLVELAKVVGLSRMHFAAQFRAATGYRPREYLLNQRIEQAKAILLNTDMPLVELALTVGFCTQSHFSTAFKRITNETPARWRCASRFQASASRSSPGREDWDEGKSRACGRALGS